MFELRKSKCESDPVCVTAAVSVFRRNWTVSDWNEVEITSVGEKMQRHTDITQRIQRTFSRSEGITLRNWRNHEMRLLMSGENCKRCANSSSPNFCWTLRTSACKFLSSACISLACSLVSPANAVKQPS